MWLCCCSRTDEIIWSAILYGVLCNSSHLNNGGCCQVNTFPAGICAAGATGLRLRSLPFFSGSLDLSLTHTLALTSLPQTLLHSFIHARPPTYLLYLPKRPRIQLLGPGSSGRQTQLHRYSWKEFWYATCCANVSWEWLHCRLELQQWPKNRAGVKSRNFCF